MINRKAKIGIITGFSLLLAALIIMGILSYRDVLLVRAPVLIQETAYLTYISGECYIREGESREWMEPEVGQKLPAGTALKTLTDGEMDVRISRDTLLRMDRNSNLVLEKSTLRQLNVHLERGRLFGRFHKMFSSQKLNISTQDMIAGIRGTDLVFETDSRGTVVYALSGITEITNPDFPDNNILLAFQKKTKVPRGLPPSQPVKMSAQEITRFSEIINSIHADKVLLITRAIRFEADTDRILPDSRDEMEKLYHQVAKTKYDLQIEGHTADIGSANAQYRLSLLRSQAVKNYLVDKGIDEDRLQVTGYGGTTPVSSNDTEEGKALNRRVEFLILE